MTVLCGSFAAFFLHTTPGFSAAADTQVEAAKKVLSSVPAPEMPAKAAALVARAKPEQRQALAVSLVQAGVALAPATAPDLTGAIVRQAPSAAAEVAAAAATLQPTAVLEIARVAASSAPAYSGDIVAAICKIFPALYGDVAVQVAAAAPAGQQAILDGLLRALPSLKPFVDRATVLASSDSSSSPSVSAIMPRTTLLVKRAAVKFSLTTDQILASGITSDQAALLTAEKSLPQPQDGVIFVPGGGEPGETNRNKIIVVEKGSGRILNYSPP